jgi:glutathione S-transferase
LSCYYRKTGNKNYSSWSLRPWLLLKQFGIEFTETRIPLYAETSKKQLLAQSTSGKVPVLKDQYLTIWDSLAICEYIAELYPDKKCWPASFQDKALARAVSSEMHSSFLHIRNMLPMNCRKKIQYTPITPDLQADIDRICQIWQECLSHSGGPFLFGQFCIADAMYAPIVLRFKSYGIKVGELETRYMQTVLVLDSLQEWISAGIEEKEVTEDAE